MRRARAGWLGLFILASLCTAVFAQTPPSLAVCLLTHNAPYAERAGPSGFDHDLGAALAERLGRRFVAVWSDNDPRIQEIDDSDFPLRRLARGECDLILSMPGPATETLRDTHGLSLGEPYYGAGFELVACTGDLTPALRALRGHAVAIQSQTVAHFALLMVKAKPTNYFSLAAALGGVRRGETEAALVWGPTAGYQLQRGADLKPCRFAPDYVPPAALRWNLHPATRTADTELRAAVDGALRALLDDGNVDRIAAGYGIPLHRPFDTTYDLGKLNALQWER